MTARTSDLLMDLALLVRKYGPEEFQEVARLLKNRELTKTLVKILEELAAQSLRPRRHAEGKPKLRMDAIEVIRQRLKDEPAMAAGLQEIETELRAGRVLPRLKDIKDFASSIDVVIRGRQRKEALNSLWASMTTLSDSALQRAISELRTFDSSRTSSLEGWSEIILPRSTPKRNSRG